MANSKRKTILNYIKNTTLALITTGNGYNYTLGTMSRGRLEIDSPPDSAFPAVFVSMVVENRENITKDKIFSRMQVGIEGYVKNSTGVSGLQQNIDDLVEDVTKAFEQDRTLGGLTAKWLEIKSIKTDESDVDSYGAMLMILEVTYASEGATP